MREIQGLKSKPYDQLNEDQKAKLGTEGKVKRNIQFLEKMIIERNIPKSVECQVPKKKTKKNDKKKTNKMNNLQLAAYKKHQQIQIPYT